MQIVIDPTGTGLEISLVIGRPDILGNLFQSFLSGTKDNLFLGNGINKGTNQCPKSSIKTNERTNEADVVVERQETKNELVSGDENNIIHSSLEINGFMIHSFKIQVYRHSCVPKDKGWIANIGLVHAFGIMFLQNIQRVSAGGHGRSMAQGKALVVNDNAHFTASVLRGARNRLFQIPRQVPHIVDGRIAGIFHGGSHVQQGAAVGIIPPYIQFARVIFRFNNRRHVIRRISRTALDNRFDSKVSSPFQGGLELGNRLFQISLQVEVEVECRLM
jgi:hypothetical protein